MNIGIYVFDGAEELDWVGPWEVLRVWAREFPADGVTVFTVADGTGPVTCAQGLRVMCDHTRAEAPPIDVLVLPGGEGTRRLVTDGSLHTWLHHMRDSGALLTSVCTGSLVLAGAGLLHDRPATTHWSTIHSLGRLDPTIRLEPDSRFVDSGSVITASGVSAGIDMALYLIARLHSPERAGTIKRYIQYDPQPPV